MFTISTDTFEELGIRMASRVLVNQGIDKVVLEVVDATLAAAQLWAYGDEVLIKRGTERYFKGKVAKLPKWGESGAVGSTYEIWGPWWDLTRCVYEQSWNGDLTSRVMLGARAVYGAGTGGGVELGETSDIRYGTDEPTAVAVNTAKELENLIDFASWRGCDLDRDELPTGIDMFPEEYVDRSVADLIIAILRWHPYAVTWFDYTSSTPELHIRVRAEMATVALSTSTDVESLQVASRDELVPPCIVIRYACKTERQYVLQYEDKYPALATGEELGAYIATVTLDEGEAWDIGEAPVGSYLLSIPTGLAQHFYTSYNDVMYDGSLTVVAASVGATEYMGKALNLTGGLAAWGTMAAPIQSVTEDIGQGVTTLEFGSGENIGIEDLLKLKDLLRKRKPKAQKARDTSPAPPTGQGPFEIYTAKVGANWVVYVYPGIVTNGEPDGEISVGDLAGALIGWGGALDRWLFVEIEPVMDSMVLLDADGDEFVEWRATASVTIVDTGIATSITQYGAARAPIVDYATGEITETGRYYFYLGSCVFNTGAAAPTPSNTRSGNFTLMHVPPARLYLMPE